MIPLLISFGVLLMGMTAAVFCGILAMAGWWSWGCSPCTWSC